MDDCTVPVEESCDRQAGGNIIINPIRSAQLTTKNSFSFRFGRVEVVAKTPRGDWLWPGKIAFCGILRSIHVMRDHFYQQTFFETIIVLQTFFSNYWSKIRFLCISHRFRGGFNTKSCSNKMCLSERITHTNKRQHSCAPNKSFLRNLFKVSKKTFFSLFFSFQPFGSFQRKTSTVNGLVK